MNLKRIISRYEDYLLIDASKDASFAIRAQALYAFGWIMIFLTAINLVVMYFQYGKLSSDHAVSSTVILLIFATLQSIRFCRNFTIYAVMVTAINFFGIGLSAIPDGTGINTSLIPMLIMIPMINGFISGPKMAILSGIACVIYVWMLFAYTIPLPGQETLTIATLQRAMQAMIGITIVSWISAVFSANIHRAFALLQKTLKEAESAHAVKDEFIGHMSHELRTPLNGILGLSETMLRSDLLPEQRKLMKSIDQSGQSLLHIVNDMLDMSMIDTQKIELHPVVTDPCRSVKDVITHWENAIEQKGLMLSIDDKDLHAKHIMIDNQKLKQILSHLISNAIQYTEVGKIAINIRCEPATPTSGHLVIDVCDTGHGISDDDIERIFQPFEQADNGAKRAHDGMGLGLSLSHNLCVAMGGSISVSSIISKGTTFTVRLPAELAPPEAIEKIAAKPTILKGVRVLIVEDNMVNQMVAEQILKHWGITSVIAENGKVCLDRLENESFDVILMDKHMPVMDGLEATAAIRALHNSKANIPIVGCSADAKPGEKERLREIGFDNFIAKPINANAIRDVLTVALQDRDAA